MLLNKEGLWTSDDMWNFKTNLNSNDSEPVKGKENWIHIENRSKAKFLGIERYGDKIILVRAEPVHQLWKQGMPNTEGYFTLENFRGKVITAMPSWLSKNGLEIRGNIILI